MNTRQTKATAMMLIFFDYEGKLPRQSRAKDRKKYDSSLKNRLRSMQWDSEEFLSEEFEDYNTEDSFSEA